MFKLVFLFVVLIAVVAVTSANPRQSHPKKASALQKHPHHGLDLHGRPAARVARSHKAHAPVHHAPGGSAVHHSNKIGSLHGGNHGVHAGNKGAAVHRPVKHRGHRK